MKAAQLNEQQKFEVVEIEDPKMNDDEVRIKVYANGVCGSDTHKIADGWPYELPVIIGHEFSGEVIEIGSNVTHVSVGDRVIAAPMMPCHECEYCQQGYYGMCENYKMIGTHRSGGFGQQVVAPKENVLPVGDMDYKTAALIEPLAVSMHGVMGIDVQLGDTVVVLGMGAVGLLTLKCLLAAGAKDVIAVDISDDSIKEAIKHGATYGINSLKEDLESKVMELTNGLGADIVMECAGSAITQEQALLLAKKHGKVGYQGIAYRDITLKRKAFENIFRRELTIKGFWNSYSAPFPGKEWQNAIDYVNSGKIDLDGMVTHTFPLNKAEELFDMIINRKENFNKVLILPQEIEE
ncbi:galactitol-1-phosphate 5-dehydrogenase [Hutsoniella sourekii]|uniref:galactitol-1-phosphate 5-dehydrogenase n=1 Tax=Hutsoniella sourekii TaxID=87650 RepID=UPI0004804FB9|nr:galactitol-1-phosphate 5-dehydrogenase [Hutsoniella sourekii]